MTSTTSVVIADDHPIVRAGVRLLVESKAGFDFVGEASSQAEVFQLISDAPPDLIVLDLESSESCGRADRGNRSKLAVSAVKRNKCVQIDRGYAIGQGQHERLIIHVRCKSFNPAAGLSFNTGVNEFNPPIVLMIVVSIYGT